MKEKTACFTGHRNLPGDSLQAIEACVKDRIVALIGCGVIYYGCGGARGFDLLAANCVIELKKQYPQIRLIMVLPCKDQANGWNDADCSNYQFVLRHADKIVYIAQEYTRRCMLDRNDHLIDHSGYCIAYLTQARGGTAYTVRRARAKGLAVDNIAADLSKQG